MQLCGKCIVFVNITHFNHPTNNVIMKHLTVVFALLIGLGTLPVMAATPPNATGNVLLKTTALNPTDLRITLANLELQNTEVVLKSLDGTRTFFREIIRKHNGYSILVDLEGLGDGKFLLEIEQDDEALHQVIVIDDGQMLMSKVVEDEVS